MVFSKKEVPMFPRFFMSMLVIFSGSLFAAGPAQYICVGGGGEDAEITVTYTPSHSNKPSRGFTFDMDLKPVLPGEHKQESITIKTEDVEYGKMISAVVSAEATDFPVSLYSIIVPTINDKMLAHAKGRLSFESVLLQGSRGGFIAPTAVSQSMKRAIGLTCEATTTISPTTR
jgi:hypothetical protein